MKPTLTFSRMYTASFHYVTVWWPNDMAVFENGSRLFTPVWYWHVPALSNAYAYRLSPDPDAYAYLRFGLLHSVERNVCLLRSPMLWGRHRLQAGHTSCFRLSRDITCSEPNVCLLSDDGPGFVPGVFGLAAYIWYKCMLSSLRMTRARTMVLSVRVSWNASLRKNRHSNDVDYRISG